MKKAVILLSTLLLVSSLPGAQSENPAAPENSTSEAHVSSESAPIPDPAKAEKLPVTQLSEIAKDVEMSKARKLYEIHVAPGGDDRNPGTAESPLATLEAARDAVRTLRAGEADKTLRHTVVLHGGIYRLERTFELDERDSYTTYKAHGQPECRISGGVAVPAAAAKLVTDPAILDRLIAEVKTKMMEIDLKPLGITDFGTLGPRGFRRPYIPAPLELIVNDEPLPIAQWPNPGQPGIKVGKVLDKGSVTRHGEKPIRGGVFELNTDRAKRWTQAQDLWITGIFNMGWADNTIKVQAIDLNKNTLTTMQPDMYGFASGAAFRNWRALNLLEEIDLPGEFMVDQSSAKLYFLPPADYDIATAKLEVTLLKDPMVAIEGSIGVVFDGITFENARGMGLYIERGADNRIQNCVIRNIGMVGVCIGKGISPDPDYRHAFTGTPVSRALGSWHEHIYDNTTFDRDAGTGQGVVNCKIYNIGAGAISLGGGDRIKLKAAGNFVENCEIFRFNRWDRTYKGAVNIDGVGNRVAHCEIYDSPALALYLHGNDHLIEYNRIHHVCMEGHDMGALYMGRDPTERGSVIRYNYWHDIGVAHMIFCLYFDDFAGDGNRVYSNLFRNAGTVATIFINGSREMIIDNNIFLDCPKYALITNQLAPSGMNAGRIKLTQSRLDAVNYRQSPWRERHPTLLEYDFAKNAMGKDIVSENNLFINCDKARSGFKTYPQIERNNRTVIGPDALNLINDIFVDPTNGNYALKPGADTGIPGFKPIPFEKIGLIHLDKKGEIQ
jgi:hypothetical protein